MRVHERAVSAFCPLAVEERKILSVVMWFYFLIYFTASEQRAALGQRQEHFL